MKLGSDPAMLGDLGPDPSLTGLLYNGRSNRGSGGLSEDQGPAGSIARGTCSKHMSPGPRSTRFSSNDNTNRHIYRCFFVSRLMHLMSSKEEAVLVKHSTKHFTGVTLFRLRYGLFYSSYFTDEGTGAQRGTVTHQGDRQEVGVQDSN